MDSLKRRKLMQGLSIAAAVLAVGALLTWNAWRPAEPEEDVRAISDFIMTRDWEGLRPEDRQAMRRKFENLDPEIRRQVFEDVARRRLEEIRAEMAGKSPEERRQLIETLRAEMRERRANISAEERARVRERLQTEEGRQMVRNAIAFYSQEFSARERAMLDPLLHEWLAGVDEIAGGQ